MMLDTMLVYRKMTVHAMLLLGLIGALPVLATDQERDVVLYGDDDFPMREVPLNDYLKRLPGIPRFDVGSTANWKGYRARWAVKESRFYLTDFGAITNGKPASVAMLFPNRKLPILADWYSGTVHIVQGTKRHNGPYEEYERITALRITNGVIIATNVMTNTREHFDGTNFVLRRAKERAPGDAKGPANRTRNR